MSTIVTEPPVIDDRGNIILHAQEGKKITLSFQNEDGTPRDMSDIVVEFRVKGKNVLTMTQGLSSDMLELVILPDFLDGLENSTVEFAWVEIENGVPDVFWSGKLVVRGWS